MHDLAPNDNSPTPAVAWATHLFAVSVHWMMRELEVAALHADVIEFTKEDRTVMVHIEASKTDPSAVGVRRVLKCICDGKCDLRCPYEVLLFLVTKAQEKKKYPYYLATDTLGNPATKAQVVGSWQYLFGPKVTGHSGRRSGALQYIRKGWSVAQVAFLGRWKSNVILEYAQEALQTMAVNVGDKFGQGETEDKIRKESEEFKILQTSVPECSELKIGVMNDLKKEIALLKSNRRKDRLVLRRSVNDLEKKMKENQKYLPPVVISQRLQVAHYNSRTLIVSSAPLWRTLCGWQYYHSNYVFADDMGTMASCQKCLALAQGKEVRMAKANRLLGWIWCRTKNGGSKCDSNQLGKWCSCGVGWMALLLNG